MMPTALATLLAQLFETRTAATQLQEDAGLEPALLPPWGELDAVAYWREVLRELDKGSAENGRERLIAAASGRYPANRELARYVVEAPERNASPFVVGTPIDRDEDFFGRRSQRSELLGALGRGQSVQILGERRMGKTSLLRWVERHAVEVQDRPVALLSAQSIDGRSPSALVRAAGHGLGRGEAVEAVLAAHASDGDARAAERAIGTLGRAVLLVDEADALAGPGHGFDDGFLGVLRDAGQEGRVVWISAGARSLFELFRQSGLTSSFLNDADKVWVGQLETDAVEELLSRRLKTEQVGVVVRQAAGFALVVQWLGRALWLGEGSVAQAVDRCAVELGEVFRGWLGARSATERRVLRRAVNTVAVEELSRAERLAARELVLRGLLWEVDERFDTRGELWREVVRDA